MIKEVTITIDKRKIGSLVGKAKMALEIITKNAEILSEMGFKVKIDIDCDPAIKKIVNQAIKTI